LKKTLAFRWAVRKLIYKERGETRNIQLVIIQVVRVLEGFVAASNSKLGSQIDSDRVSSAQMVPHCSNCFQLGLTFKTGHETNPADITAEFANKWVVRNKKRGSFNITIDSHASVIRTEQQRKIGAVGWVVDQGGGGIGTTGQDPIKGRARGFRDVLLALRGGSRRHGRGLARRQGRNS